MEQHQYGGKVAPQEDGPDLGRSFEGQGYPSYGGDLGISFVEHNSSPDLRVDTRKKSSLWIWVVVLLVVLLAVYLIYRVTSTNGNAGAASGASGAAPAGGAAGAGRPGGGRGMAGPPTITTGESQTGSISIYDDALGTVTPVNTVTLYSQITGRVMAVHYREGQMVRKGDPLVDIDPRPYQATLAQAKGTLQHDDAVLAQARLDLERYRAAYAKNAIAKQQLDDQEQVVIQYEGTVQTDQATVAYDEVQLSYAHIVAPIAGRVGLRLVDPGNTVFSGSSSTLAVITQLQPITVVFNIPEDDLAQISAQGRKKLEVDAYDRANKNLIEKGFLTSSDNQVDTTTGTVKFRATFNNKSNLFFPNQFVNARLLVRTLEHAVLVPAAAVQHNGTAAFVYVVNQPGGGPRSTITAPGEPNGTSKTTGRNGPSGPTVTTHPITVVTSNENVSAVDGISAGVTLATSGFDRLENRAEVKVANGKGNRAEGEAGRSKQGASTAGSPASSSKP